MSTAWRELASWCFEPSQPPRITSRLTTEGHLRTNHTFKNTSSIHKSTAKCWLTILDTTVNSNHSRVKSVNNKQTSVSTFHFLQLNQQKYFQNVHCMDLRKMNYDNPSKCLIHCYKVLKPVHILWALKTGSTHQPLVTTSRVDLFFSAGHHASLH